MKERRWDEDTSLTLLPVIISATQFDRSQLFLKVTRKTIYAKTIGAGADEQPEFAFLQRYQGLKTTHRCCCSSQTPEKPLFKNSLRSHNAAGFIFGLHKIQKGGCGWGAHCFLMMAAGGHFETGPLKPPKSVPPTRPPRPFLRPFVFERLPKPPSSAQANGWAAC